MKKQTRKPARKFRTKANAAVAEPSKTLDRRDLLRHARNAAIALPVLGVAGYFSVQSVQATICEADLSKIGNGRPAIVQIHDPSCQLCTTLQRQSRKVLRNFEDGTYEFLVANIKTADGGAFAAKYGVPHVTLLLFDERGEMVQVVRGPTTPDNLERVFSGHLGQTS